MKYILLITILFAFQSQAQKKKAVATKALTTAQLTALTTKMQKQLDSTAYLSLDDFQWNADKNTWTIKRDTLIIKRGTAVVVEQAESKPAQQFKPTGIQSLYTPFINDSLLSATSNSGYPLTLPATSGTVIHIPNDQEYSTLELKPLAKAYTMTLSTKDQTKEDKLNQDIADLKWQVEYFEKLLDDREKVIDKLQAIIKDLQKQIKN